MLPPRLRFGAGPSSSASARSKSSACKRRRRLTSRSLSACSNTSRIVDVLTSVLLNELKSLSISMGRKIMPTATMAIIARVQQEVQQHGQRAGPVRTKQEASRLGTEPPRKSSSSISFSSGAPAMELPEDLAGARGSCRGAVVFLAQQPRKQPQRAGLASSEASAAPTLFSSPRPSVSMSSPRDRAAQAEAAEADSGGGEEVGRVADPRACAASASSATPTLGEADAGFAGAAAFVEYTKGMPRSAWRSVCTGESSGSSWNGDACSASATSMASEVRALPWAPPPPTLDLDLTLVREWLREWLRDSAPLSRDRTVCCRPVTVGMESTLPAMSRDWVGVATP